jgi:hypothetical protein
MDLLVLSDDRGQVDMTIDAISRRTNVPPEIVCAAIEKLSEPDKSSRSPDEDGCRLVLLDVHRDWGWQIVNYHTYRNLRTEEDRREYFRQYRRKKRAEATILLESTDCSHVHSEPHISSQVFTEAEANAEAEAEAKAAAAKLLSPHAAQAIRKYFPNADDKLCNRITKACLDKFPGKQITHDEVALAILRSWDKHPDQRSPGLYLTTAPEELAEVLYHTRRNGA